MSRANSVVKKTELEKGLELSLAEPDQVQKGVIFSKNEEIRNL